ncbi:MAG: VCBS repeat-containing protein, partial [Saprospiraceae bacterium]
MQLKLYPRLLIPTPIFLFLFFLPVFLFSQTSPEICDNELDDDGDGLIDCYDQDCTCTGQCDNFYYTTCNADCYYVPPCDQINLGVQWTAQAETGTYSPLVAGDMDKDGIPDIVTYWVEKPDIYIIDGATGATKVHIVAPTDFPGGTAPAIADLDHDGFGELVLVGNDRILRCWNHDGTLAFASAIPVGYNVNYRYSVPNIADFDHDGWAEINIGNQVFNGQTGALLAQGGNGVSAGEHPARVANGFSFCSPVAMDVLPDNFCPDCAGLEIVAGNQVLSVNLVSGAVTAIVTATAPFTDGYTSVVDFDRDGDLDAIVQGRRGGQNYVYCWDIQTPTILRQFKIPNNWVEGASRVNVADLDGDGQLEISFVAYPTLFALKNNFTPLWTVSTNDLSSITCSSVFDFCGDGSSDVI